MNRLSFFALALAGIAATATGQQPFSATVVGQEPFSATAELSSSGAEMLTLSVSFSIQENHYLYADKISIKAEAPVQLIPLKAPEPKQKYDELLGERMGVYAHDVLLSFAVKGAAGAPVALTVKYQGCSNAGICYMPQTDTFSLTVADPSAGGAPPLPSSQLSAPSKPVTALKSTTPSADVRVAAKAFSLQARRSGYLNPKKFVGFLDDAEAGRGLEENALGRLFRTRGVWLLVLAVLLGGLALNLTPCVLPMIPINIAIIGAGAQAGSKRRGFALGTMYGVGIALVYGVLGLIVVLTGAKFGALNASPWFNLGIAVVFLVLSLAMFDVFTIDFSRFQGSAGTDESKRGRMITAFAMGGVAALLAGACVAPVVISVLLLSADLYAGGNATGLLLPFLLGLGMALPWPFAGAGLSFLPKPGVWMTRVKMGFGVFIILFAVWYGYLGISLLRGDAGAEATGSASSQSPEHDWQTNLADALKTAAAEGKPVFIDFWAEWCKNCLKMEKTTFKDGAVQERLEHYVKVKFRAEDMSADDIKPVLDHFGVIGLPTYVILKPGGREPGTVPE